MFILTRARRNLVIALMVIGCLLLFFSFFFWHNFFLFHSEEARLEAEIAMHNSALDPTVNYLAFLPYDGGFNNRRIQLEMQAWMALLLNRTLILPRPSSVFSKSSVNEDLHVKGSRMLDPDDVYDMETLLKAIPAIRAEDFERHGGLKLLAARQRLWELQNPELVAAGNIAGRHRALDCRNDKRRFAVAAADTNSEHEHGDEKKKMTKTLSHHWMFYCEKAEPYAAIAKSQWLDYDLGHFYKFPFRSATAAPNEQRRPHNGEDDVVEGEEEDEVDPFQAQRKPIPLPAGNLFDNKASNKDAAGVAIVPPLLFDGSEEGFRVFGNLALPNRKVLLKDSGKTALLHSLLQKMQRVFEYKNHVVLRAAETALRLLLRKRGGGGGKDDDDDGGDDGEGGGRKRAGVGDFAAFHMRRTDYQTMFPHLVSDPPSVLMRFKRFFSASPDKKKHHSSSRINISTVFIASDDDAEIKRILNMPEHRCVLSNTGDDDSAIRLVTWTDLEKMDSSLREISPASLKPLVAQLILAKASFFVGNERSSLTSFVVRMRGYAGLEKRTFYSTMGFVDNNGNNNNDGQHHHHHHQHYGAGHNLDPIVFLPAMNQGVAEAAWVWREIAN